MVESPGEFYAGLRDLFLQEDSIDADAAGLVVAETFLLWRKSFLTKK